MAANVLNPLARANNALAKALPLRKGPQYTVVIDHAGKRWAVLLPTMICNSIAHAFGFAQPEPIILGSLRGKAPALTP